MGGFVMKMRWKKKVAALTIGMMMAATMAYASISPQQVALAGIEPGMSLEQAMSIGGEVAYSDYEKVVFKSGAVVEVDDDRPGIVDKVSIRSGTAGTPAGITLGMGTDAITGAYGNADKVDYDRDDTEYIYRSTDGMKKMKFKVINGVIVKISCSLRD